MPRPAFSREDVGFGRPSRLTRFQRWGPAAPPPVPREARQPAARDGGRPGVEPSTEPSIRGAREFWPLEPGPLGQRARGDISKLPGMSVRPLAGPTWPLAPRGPGPRCPGTRPERHGAGRVAPPGLGNTACRMAHVGARSLARPPHRFPHIQILPRHRVTAQDTSRLLPIRTR